MPRTSLPACCAIRPRQRPDGSLTSRGERRQTRLGLRRRLDAWWTSCRCSSRSGALPAGRRRHVCAVRARAAWRSSHGRSVSGAASRPPRGSPDAASAEVGGSPSPARAPPCCTRELPWRWSRPGRSAASAPSFGRQLRSSQRGSTGPTSTRSRRCRPRPTACCGAVMTRQEHSRLSWRGRGGTRSRRSSHARLVTAASVACPAGLGDRTWPAPS